MNPKFAAGQLVLVGRGAGALKAGSICRVVRVIALNSAESGVPWFRYVVGPAMPAPGRPETPEVCWEQDLSAAKNEAPR